MKHLYAGVIVHQAVKPKDLQERSGIHEVIAAIREQNGDPKALFEVVDEDALSGWRIANAWLTKKALEAPDQDADDCLYAAFCDADGPITVAEAALATGIGNRALAAAARLFRNREIVVRGDPKLTHRSAITIAGR